MLSVAMSAWGVQHLDHMCSVASIKHLQLNSTSADIIRKLCRLTQITTLTLHKSNNMHETVIQHIQSMHQLRELAFKQCCMVDDIRCLTHIETVNIDVWKRNTQRCEITGTMRHK